MEIITKEDIVKSLIEVGIKNGDTVLVHSDVSNLGIVEDFTKEKLLDTYLQAFLQVVGDEGTICVPAYFYEYSRKKIPFDISLSPISKELGAFSRHIFKQTGSVRSLNPLTSICAIGKNAKEICGSNITSSYGDGCPWEKLVHLKAKNVFVGVDYKPMTFVHFPEFRANVPQRYNKLFQIPILDNGKVLFEESICYVRYIDFNVEANNDKWTEIFTRANLSKVSKCGSGKIYACELHKVYDFLICELTKNPYFLLNEKPKFLENSYPLI